MFVRRTLSLLVLAVLTANIAAASPIVANLLPVPGVDGLLRDSQSHTITEINNAGGIIIGDKLFEYFSVTSTMTAGAVAPGAGSIAITAVQVAGDYGMRFNAGWSAAAGQLADSTIEFRATILEAGFYFTDNSLLMTAYGNSTANGQVSISENIFASHPALGGNAIADEFVYYHNASDKDLQDHAEFGPLTSVWVVKDVIANGGVGSTGVAHLSEFYQTFSQAPEPCTMALLAIGGIAALVRRRKK